MDDPLRLLSSGGTDWAMAGLACASKAAGVLAFDGLVAFGMKGRAAATRHLVWGLGLAGALAVLPLSLALPRWGVPILSPSAKAPAASSDPASEGPQDDLPAVGALASIADVEARSGVHAALTPPGPAPRIAAGAVGTTRRMGPVAWPLVVWGAGTVVVLAWYAIGWATTWRLGRRAERIDDRHWLEATHEAAGRLGVAGRVTLLRGGPAAMPVTWGVLRPVVLLPAEADQWPAERRRAVLMHELAHVRRRDCLTQWLGLAACAAYWFDPLAWWAAARLRAEREQACDDLVLVAGERPSDYAAQLLGVARSLRPSPAPALAPAAMAMARPSGLELRLLAILDSHRARRGPARWLVAACVAAVLGASATLAAVRLVARDVPGPVVEGLVVGPDGKPVQEAAVVVLVSQRSDPVARESPMKAKVLGRARSGAGGRFRIDVVDDEATLDDRLLLIATAQGTGFAARTLGDLTDPIGEPLRLVPEHPLEMRLIDLEGSPLAGAEVRLLGAYPTPSGEGLGHETLTADVLPALGAGWTSDPDGRFAVRGVGPDKSLFFQVRAAGFGSQRLHLVTKSEVRTATLSLGRAHIVEGRVTLGEGGPPAVGAHLRAQSMSSSYGMGQYLGEAEATIGADGRYRIEAAPGGSVRMEVYPPREGADAYLLRGELLVPGDAVTSRVDFTLPRGVLVRGRVSEAGTGRPVAGAVVTHQAHEKNNPYFIKGNSAWFNGDEQKAFTAADGTFRLGVMPGPGYLLVKGPTADYLHEEISAVELNGQLTWPNARHYPDALRKLNPKPDDGPLDVDLTLRRGLTVRGHLVGTEGQPVRNAVLFGRTLTTSQLTIIHGHRELPIRGGRFELGGCDPDASMPVFFLDDRDQRGAVVELSGKQAGQDLEVRLRPCGSGSVRFVDEQGKPLRPGISPAHLEIVLTPGASFADIFRGVDRQSPLMADSFHFSNVDRERYRDLKTDAEGRMTFPTLIPGATYRIIVFNQPVTTQIEFTVKPGEARDLGDLVIRNVDQAG